MVDKQRIFYIDYIKAFGISLIIINHCIAWFQVIDVVNNAILSIHVPIFFVAVGLLKGYLNREEQIGSFVRKRARQLLIPYFWFSLYNSVIKMLMLACGIAGGLSEKALRDEVVEFFITGNGTVWFLMTLFLAEVLFVILKALKRQWILICSALVLMIIPYFMFDNNPFFIVIKRMAQAYFYIVLGYYTIYLLKGKKTTAILSGVCLSLWIVLVYTLDWKFSFFTGHFANPLNTIPTVVAGCLGFVALFSMVERYLPAAEYIGNNSLILMLVHPTFVLIGVYGVYAFFVKQHLSKDWEYAIFSVILLGFVYALSLLCVPLIRKYIPFVIGGRRLKEE